MNRQSALFSLGVGIAVTLAWISVASQHAAAQCVDGFLRSIAVADTGGQSVSLYFGVSSSATDGLDEVLGEFLLPTPCMEGFDARWWGVGNGTLVDIRTRGASITHTLSFGFQRGFPRGDIIVSWDPQEVSAVVESARIQDPFGGLLGIDVDMTATDQVTIASSAINGLNLIFTTRADGLPVSEIAPPATMLSITSQPGTVNSNEDFLLLVEARIATGEIGCFCGYVTATLNSGAGSLNGDRWAFAADGVATFRELRYQATADGGQDFTVSVSATGLSAGISNTVTSHVVANSLEFSALGDFGSVSGVSLVPNR